MNHREIKSRGKYVTLDILLKIDSLEMMKKNQSQKKNWKDQ